MANMLVTFFNWVGSFFSSFFSFLVKPITWILELLDGVFYFVYRLALILGDILAVALAFFQLLISIAAGLIRTVTEFLSWSGTPLSTSVGSDGIALFAQVLEPFGLNHVLPLLLMALHIFLTAYFVIWMVGGRKA